MYHVEENKRKDKGNRQIVGVEIYQKIDDPETPDLIETKTIFVSVIVPEGWQILNACQTEEASIF
jgi:methylmalonyl-CoA mutase N-terminal domain/subunit